MALCKWEGWSGHLLAALAMPAYCREPWAWPLIVGMPAYCREPWAWPLIVGMTASCRKPRVWPRMRTCTAWRAHEPRRSRAGPW